MKTSTCEICQDNADRKQKELEVDRLIQEKRDKIHKSHAMKMADLDRQIKLARSEAANTVLTDQQAKALEQRRRDLDVAQSQLQAQTNGQNTTVPPSRATASAQAKVPTSAGDQRDANASQAATVAQPQTQSPSKSEWERQKQSENASNDAIDALMKLTGLEQVKRKILDIKAKVENFTRQGLDITRERLGIVMLGNPGTGTRGSEYMTYING